MKRLEKEQPSPIEKLESWINRPDFVDRQVGFCAQWALDNLCKLVIFFNLNSHFAASWIYLNLAMQFLQL